MALKRTHFSMPEELYEQIEEVAKRHDTTVTEIVRKFLRLGLYVARLEDRAPGSELIIRDGRNVETRLVLF